MAFPELCLCKSSITKGPYMCDNATLPRLCHVLNIGVDVNICIKAEL